MMKRPLKVLASLGHQEVDIKRVQACTEKGVDSSYARFQRNLYSIVN
jgi:hypothetical protein